MRLSPTSLPRARAGFTLIEVMIAVLIIAILTTMLLVGVRQAFATAKTVQARTEMTQLAAAITQFKLKFNVDAMPSYIDVSDAANAPGSRPNADQADAFFRRMYPRSSTTLSAYLTARVPPVPVIDGPEALVFFLSGPPVSATVGFGWGSTTNPFDDSGAIKPFYEFPTSRLSVRGGATLSSFTDPWGTQPYVYFSSRETSNQYFGTGLAFPVPFRLSATRFVNPNGFQIISAGPDKEFGNNAGSVPPGIWAAGTGNFASGTVGADDLSNFHDGPLGQQQ